MFTNVAGANKPGTISAIPNLAVPWMNHAYRKDALLEQLAGQLNSDILYTEEVAALARKSVATIRWLKAVGQGPKCGKLGRRVVYRRADVEQWIASAFEGGVA